MNGTIITDGTGSRTALQGLDATTLSSATNRTTLDPVSPSSGSNHKTTTEAKTRESEKVDEVDKLLERVDDLEKQRTRETEDDKVQIVRGVETPTEEQIRRHKATHTPHKIWCRHCNEGLARRDAHRNKAKVKRKKFKTRKFGEVDVPDCEESKEGQTKSSMDYMTMGSKDDETRSPASLVVVNHKDGGAFAYATTGKGTQGDRYWLAKRVAKDIDNCGAKDTSVQVKSDQEPAIVVLQEEIRESRGGKTVCTNSLVGESVCNGRAENAIARVQAKVRTFRSQIEANTNAKIEMKRQFATWLIRWAGEVLTKYSRGIDNKTPWERRRGEACDKPIVPI